MLPRALRVLVAVIGLLAPYNQGHLLAADDRAVVARAEDVRPLDIYHGAQRPGYACWVSVWKDSDDAVYLSFSEKRSGHNDAWKPMPLDVWESMVLPRGYHTALGLGDKNIIYEFVILKSTDNGASWKEIGRSRSEDSDDTFSLATLADGRIVPPRSGTTTCSGDGRAERCSPGPKFPPTAATPGRSKANYSRGTTPRAARFACAACATARWRSSARSKRPSGPARAHHAPRQAPLRANGGHAKPVLLER